MKYKGIVIGAGLIGAQLEAETDRPKPASHCGALSMNPETELVAFVEPSDAQRDKAQILFPHARPYASLGECLQKYNPDIAVIATPPSTHLALVQELVTARVPMIICEKPVAVTLADAEAIAAAAKGSVVTVNYQRRLFPEIRKVRQLIHSGDWGRIQNISCRYSNGLFNNGGHCIDTVRFLLGEEFTAAKAVSDTENTNHPVGDVNATALLISSSGIPVTLQSFDQREYGINDIDIYFEKGKVAIGTYGYSVTKVPIGPSFFSGVSQLDSEHAETVIDKRSMIADILSHTIAAHQGAMNDALVSSAIGTMRALEMIRNATSG